MRPIRTASSPPYECVIEVPVEVRIAEDADPPDGDAPLDTEW